MNTMEDHPLAGLMPAMSTKDFKALADNIATHGLLVPITLHEGKVLDGRHRLRACLDAGVEPRFEVYDGADAIRFVVATNVHRRHLTAGQRSVIAVDVEEAYAKEAKARKVEVGKMTGRGKVPAKLPEPLGDSRDLAAAEVGVGQKAVGEAKNLKRVAPDLLEKVAAGTLSLNAAKKKRVGRERDKERAKAEKQPIAPDACRLVVCRAADLDVSDVDIICADPPYPREFLDTYTELAEFAAGALVEGGTLLAMAGQSYLPEVMVRLAHPDLTYRWTLAYLTPGGQAVQLWDRRVNTFWKPVICMTKGQIADDAPWVGDVPRSKVNDNDKNHHFWGQSESGIDSLLNGFARPGMLVCDPFLGGGTTAMVAVTRRYRFVGCDIDAEAVKRVHQRVASEFVAEAA